MVLYEILLDASDLKKTLADFQAESLNDLTQEQCEILVNNYEAKRHDSLENFIDEFNDGTVSDLNFLVKFD